MSALLWNIESNLFTVVWPSCRTHCTMGDHTYSHPHTYIHTQMNRDRTTCWQTCCLLKAVKKTWAVPRPLMRTDIASCCARQNGIVFPWTTLTTIYIQSYFIHCLYASIRPPVFIINIFSSFYTHLNNIWVQGAR